LIANLSFDDFASQMAFDLRLHTGEWTHESRLIGDLGLDSLQMVELLVLMYDIGAPLPDGILGEHTTAGDLYFHYRSHTDARA